ncbi:MAG: hypothetical protein WC777_03750 [Candidatus Gracilibacteria bacterium]
MSQLDASQRNLFEMIQSAPVVGSEAADPVRDLLAQARIRLDQSGLVPLVFEEGRQRYDGGPVIGGDAFYYVGQRRNDVGVNDAVIERLRRKMAGDEAFTRAALWMPKGIQVVGVRPDGQLEIRQASTEIVNARWSTNYPAEPRDRSGLRLLPHDEAEAQERGAWATILEIHHAVKAAGYHVPEDAPNLKKSGLVAASEAVMGTRYVMGSGDWSWRNASLESPDDIDGKVLVRSVRSLHRGGESIEERKASVSDHNHGAVLWLRA